jgi:hypothetical protein
LPGIFAIEVGKERRAGRNFNGLSDEFPCRPIGKIFRPNREIKSNNREITGNISGLPPDAAARRGDDRVDMYAL